MWWNKLDVENRTFLERKKICRAGLEQGAAGQGGVGRDTWPAPLLHEIKGVPTTQSCGCCCPTAASCHVTAATTAASSCRLTAAASSSRLTAAASSSRLTAAANSKNRLRAAGVSSRLTAAVSYHRLTAAASSKNRLSAAASSNRLIVAGYNTVGWPIAAAPSACDAW